MKRALFGVALGLGIGLRLYVAFADDERRADETWRYAPLAENLRAGEGFSIHGRPTAQSLPLWPVLLAAWPRDVRPELLSAALSVATMLLAWRVAHRLAGPKVALAVFCLMAVDLDQVVLAGTILTEPLYGFLVALFALAWVEKRILYAAFALALAVLVRPEPFLFPFAIFLWDRSIARAGILVGACVVALLPWWVRNADTFGTFLPFTTTGGMTATAGMNEGEEDLAFRSKGQGCAPNWKEIVNVAPDRDEVADDRELMRQALAYARANPLEALQITAAKAMLLWTPVQRKDTSAVYALAVLFAWWGIFKGVRFKPPLVGPLLCVMTFVGLCFLAIPRYRAPYHAFAFLLAAAAVPRLARIDPEAAST